MPRTYFSVCSGIEAATAAWHPLGWHPLGFAEIEPFPSAVLKHHYPDVTNFGDFTKIQLEQLDGRPNVIIGGTPCQSFSVAGLREGLASDNGNLALEFIRLLDRCRPEYVIWENVAGVLSSNGGRDFATFLGALAKLGYGFAYRVLDAQYFGVPQRRRRVFVVGHSNNWRRAAAVLFERESLPGNFTPVKKARKGVTQTLKTSPFNGGRESDDFGVSGGLQVKHKNDTAKPGNGMGIKPEQSPTLTRVDRHAVAIHGTQDPLFAAESAHTLGRNNGQENALFVPDESVRRLTPVECERLQGFPDDFTRVDYRSRALPEKIREDFEKFAKRTRIDPDSRKSKNIFMCPDGPRYKALGNSMAVPVIKWLGERIDLIDSLDANK